MSAFAPKPVLPMVGGNAPPMAASSGASSGRESAISSDSRTRKLSGVVRSAGVPVLDSRKASSTSQSGGVQPGSVPMAVAESQQAEAAANGEMEEEDVPKTQKKSHYQLATEQLNGKSHARDVRAEKRIGFYRLKQSIGKGAFGVVKLGVHTITNCQVAIKIVDKGRLSVRETKTLIREMHLLDQMHHPNILRLYEVKETAGKMYIVMEYASRGDLYAHVREVCAEGKMEEGEAARAFAEICAAVEHCHGKHVVHRDIKAENVLFDQFGRAKLCDFGLSRSYEEHRPLSTYCGSPHYCAPEIFKQVEYDGTKFDLWSLGVLLYFMVTGRMPFEAESVPKIKERVIEGKFSIPQYVSEDCCEVIRGILQLEPDERWGFPKLRDCAMLRSSIFPEAEEELAKPERGFEDDDEEEGPSKDEILANSEVLQRMKEIGISVNTLHTSHMEKQSRSSIVGMYRLLSHKIQKENTGEDGVVGSSALESDDTGPGSLQPGGSAKPGSAAAGSGPTSVADGPPGTKSKTCTIL